ncbi:unnamed protein product [Cyprideis torosa]|uniref:Uncharacterized protein n=1 Tax=Cyprideis torosa TaxID=163714 RepID=A0A7R8WFY4_9CRUS|nr:unnamed protein product [Cyprideis torosa]CAG0897567.1 unnamed protein product [Cyprideis torosa]
MIVYCMLARLPDGMVLCDCTDVKEEDEQRKESKKLMKALLRRASILGNRRCVVRGAYNSIYTSSSLNLICLSLCLSNYAPVLAFTFNEQLMNEFIRVHSPSAEEQIKRAHRPYVFLSFDPVMQSLRNRFNSSTSFQAKLNISDLTYELRCNPPLIIHPKDLLGGSGNDGFPRGTSNGTPSTWRQKTSPPVCIGGTSHDGSSEYQLEPLRPFHIGFVGITIILGLVSFYRGVHTLNMQTIEEYEGPSLFHAFAFLIEFAFQCLQVILVSFLLPLKSVLGHTSTAFIVLTSLSLWDVREVVLTFVTFLCGCLMGSWIIPHRRLELRCPRLYPIQGRRMDPLTAASDPSHNLRVGMNSVVNIRSNMESLMRHLSLSSVDKDDSLESKEKYLAAFQQKLQKISNDVRELESSLNALSVPLNSLFLLGSMGHLAQDPSSDKNALYPKLIQSYSWLDQLKEFAGVGMGIISLNSIKRTLVTSAMGRKTRRGFAATHNPPPDTVNAILMAMDRSLNDLTITNIFRPYGSNAVVQLALGRVLRALVIFRGLMIESVVIKGFGESNCDEETGHLNPWKQSNFKVFRKVTENANAAMLHYYSPVMPDLAVRSFMTWLHSYVDLFSKPCSRCGSHLFGLKPPTWRDFRDLSAYHDECKPTW